MKQQLHALAFASASATIAAVAMLGLSLFGRAGFYGGAVEHMRGWHMYYSLSAGGIVGGMIEAAFWSFIVCYLFAYLYNRLVDKMKA